MQIVIDIPEEMYADIKEGYSCSEYGDELVGKVNDGIPLPKGHGDLVDRSKIDMSAEWRNVSLSDKSLWIANGILNDVETVIPADKGDAE